MVLKIFFILITLSIWSTNSFAAVGFRCIVFDVGEGQAVLFQRGESGVLIDTGHFGNGFELLTAIQKYGVSTIDKVILTHLHPDHASGLFTIMNRFPDAEIYESGHRIEFNPNMDGYRWVAEALDSKRWKVTAVRQGDVITWQSIKFHILWPNTLAGDSLNYQSLVVEAEYGKRKVVIMGDANKEVEHQLLSDGLLPAAIDVLVVGHHGAGDATSSKFLERIAPEYGVISVNKDNKRGYPSRNVVRELISKNIKVHLTAEKGDFVWPSATSLDL